MFELPPNLIDSIILGFVGISSIYAFFRGIGKEIVSFVAWAGATYAAFLYVFSSLSNLNFEYIASLTSLDAIIGSALFITALILLTLAGKFATKPLYWRGWKMLNRISGLFYGAARAVVAIALIYFTMIHYFPDQKQIQTVQESTFLPVIEEYGLIVYEWVYNTAEEQNVPVGEDVLGEAPRNFNSRMQDSLES